MKPLVVSVDEFQRLACIGKTLAFALIKNGDVVTAKFGRKTVVTLASIEALIERHTVKHGQ